MLPLKTRLDFFAILTFHKIIHKAIAIELPNYISLVSQSRLRLSHKDPLTFESLIKPRVTKKAQGKKKTSARNNTSTIAIPKLKCKRKNTTKIKSKSTKGKKNKASIFFRKHKKCEKIYVEDKNTTDEFSENKVFSNSYFYKTHTQWNKLPLEIRIIEDHEKFKAQLEQHLWDSITELEDHESNDLSFERV